MEFDEAKSKEIAARCGLSEKTVNVWRHRGRIPDKYADEGYRPVPEPSKADKIILKRIAELKSNDYINFTVLAELSGVDMQHLYDAVRGKGKIGKEELEKVVLELKKLKVFINNNLQNSPKRLNNLLSNKLLKFYSINGKDGWAKAMYYAMSKQNQLATADFMRLKDNYIKVYIMLNL